MKAERSKLPEEYINHDILLTLEVPLAYNFSESVASFHEAAIKYKGHISPTSMKLLSAYSTSLLPQLPAVELLEMRSPGPRRAFA
jgi:hypothetical protein